MNAGFSQYVTDDKFCAGLENGTSVEQGDSGGGLIIPKNSINNDLRYYIVGIVSTKDLGTNIATFTNINKLRPWLNQTVLSFIEEGYCPPLISNSVELTQCNFNGTEVDCKKPTMPGTKAKLQCKNSFHGEFPYPLYTDTECQKNLTWSPLMDSCLECGRRYKFNNYEPLITYKERKVSEFPWHVGIYKKNEEGIKFACGGTIIHPKVILIAAVCAYLHGPERTSNPKDFFVVAGKYERKWTIKANFEQRFQVSSIMVHRIYATDRTKNEADIAMLVLNDTIKTSSYIMPACIDWSNKQKLLDKPYVAGLIAGWGITEDGVISNVLRSTEVLMINRTRCSLRSLEIVLTPDKWCIISEDGSGVSLGDVGGIVFPKFEEDIGKLTYYLSGILSNSVSKDTNSVTDVLYYENWIKQIFMYILNSVKRTK
ncbi:unnamed protein product [Nezara viridula]|nr:unnamed protein product [Nezara viridula]